MAQLRRWWHSITGSEQQRRLRQAEAELEREVEDLTVVSERTQIISRSERAVQNLRREMKHDA